jgi:hypothetical protein
LALCLGLLLATSARATVTDRGYTLGDDPGQGASDGAVVGAQTFDSAGTIGAGDLQDLNTSGGPFYRAVDGGTGRPGAATGDLGIEFDGSDDLLFTPISLNAPAQTWNNTTFFPGPPPQIFPHNYEGIFAHGVQLWAKPTVTGAVQVLVEDTVEAGGVVITENDTWGLRFDFAGDVDSGVTVASTLDSNGWAHVMQIAGAGSPVAGNSAFDGAMLVNGVAVAGRPGAYDPSSGPLSIGAKVELDIEGALVSSSDYYTGILDDVDIFIWGDNSDELGADNAPGGVNDGTALNADGQNWGALNLNVDNDWIAQKLASFGVGPIPDTDLDFDGDTDSADEALFIAGWRSETVVNGLRVGDWNSRQSGDFNYDGVTDLADAFLIHDALAPLGGLNFAALGAVPEPTSVVLLLLGSATLGAVRNRQCI